MVTKRLQITGRVQGVGFRYYFQRTAAAQGVRGWVRNRSDGSVEAVIQGEEASVHEVIAWAKRGPRNAMVSDVTVTAADGEYHHFEIRATE